MILIWRLIVALEWVLIGLFALLLLLSSLDLVQAWNSHACSVQLTPDCYPWGWHEGPLADTGWGYESQRNYLVSGAFLNLMLFSALICTLWLRPGRKIVALLAAMLVLKAGEYALPLIF